MNDTNSEKIQAFVAANTLEKAIAIAERVIAKNKISDFAPLVSKDILHLTDSLVAYIDTFIAKASKEVEVKALYAEMNGFAINYDLWFVELFAFDKNEGLEDADWLADYAYAAPDEEFVITGLEEIQAVYKDYMDKDKWENDKMEAAAEDGVILIVLRLQELFKAAKESAKAKNMAWAHLPIYVTAHDHYLDSTYEA
jgi:hypothetical protein